MDDIITLKDCSIANIETDMDCLCEGCQTCGYGSDYCTTVKLVFQDHNYKYTYLSAQYHESYNYNEEFSIGYFVRLFAKNYNLIESFAKDEFVTWYKEQLKKDFQEVDFY